MQGIARKMGWKGFIMGRRLCLILFNNFPEAEKLFLNKDQYDASALIEGWADRRMLIGYET